METRVKYKLFFLFFLWIFFTGSSVYGFSLSVKVDSVSCNGGSDGKVVITVNGGVAPYIFTWSTGEKDTTNNPVDSLINLEAGYYWVVVEDASPAPSELRNIFVYEPDSLNIDSQTVTDVTCHSGSDGSISVTVSGGTTPYGYFWSGPDSYTSTNEDIGGLVAGDYLLTVTDDNGCTYIYGPVTVSEPVAMVISTTKTDVTCYGDSNGTIDVTVNGGTSPYTYSIDGGVIFLNNGGNFSGLGKGNYAVAVQDSKNCIENGNTLVIEEPTDIQFDGQVKTDVTCHGANDGTITITVSGGTAPYVYSIDGGTVYDDNGGTFTGLSPGSYDLSVRDNNGCVKSGDTININEPAKLIIVSEAKTDISCHGGDDGTITVNASGGTPPFEYSIDGGTTFSPNGGTFTTLTSGNYDVAVRDAHGCITNGSTVTLSEPSAVTITSHIQTDVSCYGGSDGSITVTVSGGIPPYVYSIDGGNVFEDNSGNFTGLTAGDYPLAVRDGHGCILLSDTLLMIQPPLLHFDSQTRHNISCHGLADGSITIEVSGGTPPYQYSVDGGTIYGDTNVISDLSAGDYNIMVRDAQGCLLPGKTLSISEPRLLSIDSVHISDVLCYGGNSGVIEIFTSGGSGFLEYSVNNGASFYDNSGVFNQLIANAYHPVVRDVNGCTASGPQINISESSAIDVTADTVKPSCSRHTLDGKITIHAVGGAGNFVYSIDNGLTFGSQQMFTGLEGGNYTIKVKDGNGCIVSDTVELTGRYIVIANAGQDTSICPGKSVVLSGSGGPTYQWAPAQFLDDPTAPDPVASPDSSTDFTLRVASGNCYDMDTVRVLVFPVHGITAGRDTVIMEGTTVTLAATGEGFTDYFWYPPEGLVSNTGPSVKAKPDKDMVYFVAATTTEGCVEVDSVKIMLAQGIFIPSGFTPNDDGTNDTWQFGHAEFYPEIIVEVFNRWGERVFYSRGYDSSKEWNGTYKGKPLPSGTYYYVIKLNDQKHTPPFTGPVTIMR